MAPLLPSLPQTFYRLKGLLTVRSGKCIVHMHTIE